MLPQHSQTEVDEINHKLALYFGLEPDLRARYRVVWADDQLEKRHGEYNIFCEGYFLRTEVGIREVKKYPDFSGKYVLERILYYPMAEVVGSENGVYEAVFTFEDKKGNYLPPNWYVCEIVCKNLEAPKQKRTEKDFLAEEEKIKQKEIEFFTDYLGEIGPSPLFYPGETGKQGVFIDSTKVKK